MATIVIEIGLKANSLEVVRDYAIVSDSGVVSFRRNTRQIQTAEEAANPNVTPNITDYPMFNVTLEQIKELTTQLA
jgi:hypothetical protein